MVLFADINIVSPQNAVVGPGKENGTWKPAVQFFCPSARQIRSAQAVCRGVNWVSAKLFLRRRIRAFTDSDTTVANFREVFGRAPIFCTSFYNPGKVENPVKIEYAEVTTKRKTGYYNRATLSIGSLRVFRRIVFGSCSVFGRQFSFAERGLSGASSRND